MEDIITLERQDRQRYDAYDDGSTTSFTGEFIIGQYLYEYTLLWICTRFVAETRENPADEEGYHTIGMLIQYDEDGNETDLTNVWTVEQLCKHIAL